MLESTLSLVHKEIETLEKNKEYNVREFCANVAIWSGRNVRSIKEALCVLNDTHKIKIEYKLFVVVQA